MEVILAISFEMFASWITALGYAFQKKAHLQSQASGGVVVKKWAWWFGLILMFIGLPFNAISLLLADQSLLSTLGPFSTIFALVIGRFMLKEKLYNRHYIAATLMIVGSMLALSFASKNTAKYNIKQIMHRLSSPSSLATITVNFTLMAIFLILSYKIVKDIRSISQYFSKIEMDKWMLKLPRNPIGGINYSLQIDETAKNEKERIELLSQAKKKTFVHNPRWLKLWVFALPWFAGFMSGLLGLSAKCSIMLGTHMTENHNYKSPFTYILFCLPVIFIISELTLLNLGLRLFETWYIIPIFKASVVFHNTMWGGILLQEFFDFKVLHMIMFSVGILICIWGILVMLVPPEKPNKDFLGVSLDDSYLSEALVSTTASDHSTGDIEESKM